MMKRNGSPYDRGSADSYYGRSPRPHFYTCASYFTNKVEQANMTPQQVQEYYAGYDDNDDAKDWGNDDDCVD